MKSYPIAIVTGASQGIGRVCANGLTKKGYRTVIAARNKSKLHETADEIAKANSIGQVPTIKQKPDPVIYPLDVTRFHEIEPFVMDVFQRFGRIDILVNNAGVFKTGTLETSNSDVNNMVYTNLLAPFHFLKHVIPIMKKQGWGHIFNIASRAGKIGLKGEGVYSASKHGLMGLNESLFRELAHDKISITGICPGWVNTEMAHQGNAPLSAEEMIQPDDVMKTISWILDLAPNTCIREVSLDCYKSII